MQNIPEDFAICSMGNSVRASFAMMSVTCRLFSQKRFPEMQYETYLPVSEDVLKTFVSCVYFLVINPDSVKAKITRDNVHYLSLLAEEFQCSPLSREIEDYIKVQKETEVASAESNVTKLEEAIRKQEHEIVSHFESLLASDFANALEVLARVPSTRIPISCVYRIVEKALEKNPEPVNESVLCDFVLARLAEGDGNEACALVQFLHLDKLHWGQVRKLMGSEKLRDWYDEKFPVRFLDELISKMDTRMSDIERDLSGRFERLEAALMEKFKRSEDSLVERITRIQGENERLRDGIRAREEEMKRSIEERIRASEAKVNREADSTTPRTEQAEKVVSEKACDPPLASRPELAKTLLIEDLPQTVQREFLFQFLGEAGPVEDVVLKNDRKDRRGRDICYAFVTFGDHETAKRALEDLNYTKLDGVPIRMSWADEETSMIRKSGEGSLFIKGLDKSIEVSQLHEAFANFGEIISCKIATDEDHRSLGYGYVQFRRREDAIQCMNDLKDAAINGIPIHIEPYQKMTRQNPEETYKLVCVKGLPETVVDRESFLELLKRFYPAICENIDSTPDSPQPKLVIDNGGVSKGRGFCLMKGHPEAVELAAALNGKEVDGHVIEAGRFKSREERAREIRQRSEQWRQAQQEKYRGRSMYVRGFDEHFTEEELSQKFSGFGAIESLEIMRDEDGKSKKFGFVYFVDQESAQRALAASPLIQFGDSQAYCALSLPASELKRRSMERSRRKGENSKPAPAYEPQAQPCGWFGYPGADFGGQTFAFPSMQFPAGPFAMPATPQSDCDLIKAEIVERVGKEDQALLRRLRDLSDDQCHSLTQNQPMLIEWIYTFRSRD